MTFQACFNAPKYQFQTLKPLQSAITTDFLPMKHLATAAFISLLTLSFAPCAQEAPNTPATATAPALDPSSTPSTSQTSGQELPVRPVLSPEAANFCLFTGEAPAAHAHKVTRKIKMGKGTYGSVRDILPRMVEIAQQSGAQAIIHYNGSQRFGFFPWRMVRPVVTGQAIQWATPPVESCAALGGHRLQDILDSGEAPEPPARVKPVNAAP